MRIDDDETAAFVENMMRNTMATPTTDRGKSNRTLRRIKDRLAVEFPIGCRVTMSAEGEERFPAYAGRFGEVVGYENEVSPKVRFDGNRTASGWNPDFIRRINAPDPTTTHLRQK